VIGAFKDIDYFVTDEATRPLLKGQSRKTLDKFIFV
jgi:hypothetical protein